jgi:hypothetical protein
MDWCFWEEVITIISCIAYFQGTTQVPGNLGRSIVRCFSTTLTRRKPKTLKWVGFDVLTAVTMESTVSWVVIPCSLEGAWRFWRNMSPLVFRVKSERSKKLEAGGKVSWRWRRYMFLWNFRLCGNYTAIQTRKTIIKSILNMFHIIGICHCNCMCVKGY